MAGIRKTEERRQKGTLKWQSRNILSFPEKFFKRVLLNNELFDKCIVNYMIDKKDLGINEHGNYFLDFYFPEKKIDMEIDGKQHEYNDRKDSDKKRDTLLKKNGYKVYRIKWNEINTDNGKKMMEKK